MELVEDETSLMYAELSNFLDRCKEHPEQFNTMAKSVQSKDLFSKRGTAFNGG